MTIEHHQDNQEDRNRPLLVTVFPSIYATQCHSKVDRRDQGYHYDLSFE